MLILTDLLDACDRVASERQEWLDRIVIASGRFAPPFAMHRFHRFVARYNGADGPE